MTDLISVLNALRRPRLLIRAARFGLNDYNRNRDLSRLVTAPALPSPGRAMGDLMDAEQNLEDKRKTGDAAYNIARHIEVLIALMAEARLLNALRPSS